MQLNRFKPHIIYSFLVFVVLLMTGCSEPEVEAEVESTPLAELSDYYSQEITWSKCDDSLFIDSGFFVKEFKKNDVLCAQVVVPTSYQDLNIGVFNIQLMKDPAEVDEAETLFINPGGPGGSGVEFVQYFAAGSEIRKNFDIIGFDPRGVNNSDEIRCDDERDLNSYFDIDFYIDSESEVAEYEEFSQAFIDDCATANPLWGYVNSENTVRDLDILRAVITGDAPLNFSGTSYGTTLGVEYVRLFSENVGKIVLDAPVENKEDSDEEILRDVESYNQALERLFERCAQDKECPGESVSEVASIIQKALIAADNGELTGVYGVKDHPKYTNRTYGSGTILFEGIFQMTYYSVDEIYSEFKAGMKEIVELDYPIFEWYGLTYAGYDPESKKRDNSSEILQIVNCLDVDGRDFSTEEELRELERKISEVAPTYYFLVNPPNNFFYMQDEAGCEWSWKAFEDPTVADPPKAFPPAANNSGKTLLVISSLYDNVTPHSGAVATADLLDSPLVTLEGDGHGIGYTGNKCVSGYIEDYLLRGIAPKENVVCK
jgi:pimeloyl-ACP methyl ester carboxylesterase